MLPFALKMSKMKLKTIEGRQIWILELGLQNMSTCKKAYNAISIKDGYFYSASNSFIFNLILKSQNSKFYAEKNHETLHSI